MATTASRRDRAFASPAAIEPSPWSSSSGYPAAQVFSPPGADFICFEPMTAPTNALRSGVGLRLVEAGDAFTAAFSIAVG